MLLGHEVRGSGSFQHTQGKAFRIPHLRRPNFSKVFILHTDWSALSIGVILSQLDEEGIEYVMHPKATTRLKATILHKRGNVLLLYGSSYISGPNFMAPSSLYMPTTNLSSG